MENFVIDTIKIMIKMIITTTIIIVKIIIILLLQTKCKS